MALRVNDSFCAVRQGISCVEMTVTEINPESQTTTLRVTYPDSAQIREVTLNLRREEKVPGREGMTVKATKITSESGHYSVVLQGWPSRDYRFEVRRP